MHVFRDNDSQALLPGDNQGREESATGDKPNMDRTKRDSTCSSTRNGEAFTLKNVVVEAKPEVERGVLNHYEKAPTVFMQNGSHSNIQKEDFSAKDLLSFAWQIARGMVC